MTNLPVNHPDCVMDSRHSRCCPVDQLHSVLLSLIETPTSSAQFLLSASSVVQYVRARMVRALLFHNISNKLSRRWYWMRILSVAEEILIGAAVSEGDTRNRCLLKICKIGAMSSVLQCHLHSASSFSESFLAWLEQIRKQ